MSSLSDLKNAFNQYAATPLHYILQPQYRSLNKAQRCYDGLTALAQQIHEIERNPQHAHDASIAPAFKEQREILDLLMRDYPQPENITALQEANEHLKHAFDCVKKIRQEVPVESAQANKARL
jgi:anion-transporting  ArsA/GET3 family ATPase